MSKPSSNGWISTANGPIGEGFGWLFLMPMSQRRMRCANHARAVHVQCTRLTSTLHLPT